MKKINIQRFYFTRGNYPAYTVNINMGVDDTLNKYQDYIKELANQLEIPSISPESTEGSVFWKVNSELDMDKYVEDRGSDINFNEYSLSNTISLYMFDKIPATDIEMFKKLSNFCITFKNDEFPQLANDPEDSPATIFNKYLVKAYIKDFETCDFHRPEGYGFCSWNIKDEDSEIGEGNEFGLYVYKGLPLKVSLNNNIISIFLTRFDYSPMAIEGGGGTGGNYTTNDYAYSYFDVNTFAGTTTTYLLKLYPVDVDRLCGND